MFKGKSLKRNRYHRGKWYMFFRGLRYFLEDIIFAPIKIYAFWKYKKDIANAFWYMQCFYWGQRIYKVEEDPYLGDIYAKKDN